MLVVRKCSEKEILEYSTDTLKVYLDRVTVVCYYSPVVGNDIIGGFKYKTGVGGQSKSI